MNEYKKKLILFDLDGVLIDSKKNMEEAWGKTCVKFDLDFSFHDYFSNIGRPFRDILTILDISGRQEDIEEFYKKSSTNSLNDIKIYEGVKEGLNRLVMQDIKVGIVTSKDNNRTSFFVKQMNINFSTIRTPDEICRGKPAPDHLLMAMATQNIDPSDTLFIGDMNVDYLSAKRANIDYAHASWGYGTCDDEKVTLLKTFLDLDKY